MDSTSLNALIALGPALWEVWKILITRGTDLALDKGLEPLEDMIKRGYDKRKDSEILRKAILSTLDEVTDGNDVDRYDKFLATLKLTGLDEKKRLALAGAAVEMAQFLPASISSDLLKLINLAESKRALLARFLFALRQNLAGNTRFKAGIAYANSLEQIGQLNGLTNQMISLGKRVERLVSLEEALVVERHLTTDEELALKDYLTEVRRRWEGLMLPLIRKKSGDITSAKLKQVFVPLTLRDVHTEEYARRRVGCLLPSEDTKKHEEHLIGIGELLNRHERFILIGPPGCGKTTLLDRIALACAEGLAADDLGWKGQPLFPLFLRLRNFGAFLKQNKDDFPAPCSGSLIAYLENQFRTGERINLTAQFFDHRLGEGNCLVLMDGLDEVSEQRSEIARHITAFIDQYATNGNRFGLASRPRGYETVELQLRPLNLAVAEVNPLGQNGICQLIENLLALIEPDSALRNADCSNLTQAISASIELTNIAGTPLFCSALVQVYKYHGAALPQRRVDVFDEIVDLLLGFWKAQERQLSEAEQLASEDGTGKLYREIKDAVAVKHRRLSYLAYWMQQKGKAEIERAEAVSVLAEFLMQRERVLDPDIAQAWADNFLENSHERSGLLVERDPGFYAFLHKGFMEYLAASAVVNQSKTLVETLLAHMNNEWWEQVILLAGAHPKLAEDFRTELIEATIKTVYAYSPDSDEYLRRLVMAGRLVRDMAGYLPGLQHEQVETILHATATQLELSPERRAVASDTLDEIGWQPEDLSKFVAIPVTASAEIWIGKYPVTNLQYKRFLDDSEFTAKRFWVNFPAFDKNGKLIKDADNDEGYQWLRKSLKDKEVSSNGRCIYPRSWNNPRFSITRKCMPVVSITWYEANAYCKWLKERWHQLDEGRANSEFTPYLIRLPTEAEWILAAGGANPEARFPWDIRGRITNAVKEILQCANVSESNIRHTTPVWMYPLGQSQLGVWDLAGNIWEWQANYSDKKQNNGMLRGGSWSNTSDIVNMSVCYQHYSLGWDLNIGFRVMAFPD